MSIVFRDDDVLYSPKMAIKPDEVNHFERFKWVDSLFKKYGVKHVIAILASGIDDNPEWVDYINHSDCEIQLHGWDHTDFTLNHDTAKERFEKSLDKIESTFGVRPAVWFPPWNKSDPFIDEIARSLGLEVSFKKISLPQFVAFSKVDPDTVLNFHYWASCDTDYLEQALIKYKRDYAD